MPKTILVLQPSPALDVPPAPPAATNEALMSAIQQGDGEAFFMLYRRHAELIRGVIARFVADEDEREDVLREVFESIRDRAEHYTANKGRVLGWMITLARRCAIDRVRRSEASDRLATSDHARLNFARAHQQKTKAALNSLRAWWREATA